MRFLKLPRTGVVAVIVSFAFAARAVEALPPDQVFERVEPTVVVIHHLEGSGTGVVLSKDGLIITNYHVVATPLPITVVAKVKGANGVEERTFENVKVHQVHPEYDLALLKIEKPGAALASAKLVPKGSPVKTGQKCYAIGNPGSSEEIDLSKTITSGLVSSATRKIEELEYIQVDAAINPGNSGGALCNEEGQVIGIVTFKLDMAEGISFAIPTQKLQLDQFVEPKLRVGNVELANQLQRKAIEIENRAAFVFGPDHDVLMEFAGIYHRLALAESPGDPSFFHNVGGLWLRKEDNPDAQKNAAAYFQAALEVKPNYAPSAEALAKILMAQDNPEKAEKVLLAGVLDPSVNTKESSARAAGSCAHYLGVIASERGENSKAAYFMGWANSLNPAGQAQISARRSIYRAAAGTLPEQQIAALQAMVDPADFSLEGMETFATAAPSAVAKVIQDVQDPATETPAEKKAPLSMTARVEFPLDVTGTDIKLEDGPEGLRIDVSAKKIIWEIPPHHPGGEAEVLLSYKNATGRDGYHIAKIHGKKG